jgi:hypothetical protein
MLEVTLPHVDAWKVGGNEVERVESLSDAKADLIVLLTNHSAYTAEALPEGIPVLDTRGALRGTEGVETL